MKFIHLSDLHLGKRVNEFSMLEEQEYILSEIIHLAKEEKPDGALIAGDIYDKPVPSAEAVQLFDDFLFRLSGFCPHIFVASGNHDSPERLAFGGRLMGKGGVHLSPVYDGNIVVETMEDAYGALHIYMLPFLKPSHVRRFFPEEEINTYTDAVFAALSSLPVKTSDRNILAAHQFVTGAMRSDSEEVSVGGTENVEAFVFDSFDYVALGHLHNPQQVQRETIRYCGAPLKYSFSEAGREKSMTIAEFYEKGNVQIRTIPLIPRHDVREIRGSYMEVASRDFYKDSAADDYLHITLTDEEDIPDAIGKLRVIYPNLMRLDYDNKRTRSGNQVIGTDGVEDKTPMELFAEFYERQNNQPLNGEQQKLVEAYIQEIWEGEA